MVDLREKTVASLVSDDIRTASVFKRYQIDFCCNGNKMVSDVCNSKGIDIDELQIALDSITHSNAQEHDYNSDNLSTLVDSIINSHHNYIKENIPLIDDLVDKVESVHGQNHPELSQIQYLWRGISTELTEHMVKEELALFPYILNIETSILTGQKLQKPAFESILNPIKMMEGEHEFAGTGLARIAELTNNYTPPADACTSFMALYQLLEEFQDDLHIHVHLENNILFPKALQFENTLETH